MLPPTCKSGFATELHVPFAQLSPCIVCNSIHDLCLYQLNEHIVIIAE